MFNRILVPLDGSEEAERITGWLAGFVSSLGAEIELLAVIEPERLSLPEKSAHHRAVRSRRPGSGPYGRPADGLPLSGLENRRYPAIGGWDRAEPPPAFGTQVVDHATEEARRYLHHRSQFLAAMGIKATTSVAVGSPAREITRRAKSSSIDLIVMSTSRKHLVSPSVLGAVADEVLRTTPVPLLTMHAHGHSCPLPKLGKPSTIVVPLDGSELAEGAVPVALSLAKTTNAQLVFIWVLPVPRTSPDALGAGFYASYSVLNDEVTAATEYLDTFARQAHSSGLKTATRVSLGRAASGIEETTRDDPGALVVMTTHGKTGFRRWALGSVTEEVVRTSGRPVLVLPPGVHGRDRGHRDSHKRREHLASVYPALEDERSRVEKEHESQLERVHEWASRTPQL